MRCEQAAAARSSLVAGATNPCSAPIEPKVRLSRAIMLRAGGKPLEEPCQCTHGIGSWSLLCEACGRQPLAQFSWSCYRRCAADEQQCEAGAAAAGAGVTWHDDFAAAPRRARGAEHAGDRRAGTRLIMNGRRCKKLGESCRRRWRRWCLSWLRHDQRRTSARAAPRFFAPQKNGPRTLQR